MSSTKVINLINKNYIRKPPKGKSLHQKSKTEVTLNNQSNSKQNISKETQTLDGDQGRSVLNDDIHSLMTIPHSNSLRQIDRVIRQRRDVLRLKMKQLVRTQNNTPTTQKKSYQKQSLILNKRNKIISLSSIKKNVFGNSSKFSEVSNGVRSMLKESVKRISNEYYINVIPLFYLFLGYYIPDELNNHFRNNSNTISHENLNTMSTPIKDMIDKTILKNQTKNKRK